jgi:hypothetical protein
VNTTSCERSTYPNIPCASVARKHQPKTFTTRRVVGATLTMLKRGLRYVVNVTDGYTTMPELHGKKDG